MDKFTQIRAWAEARNLVDGSNPQAQFVKLAEEIGELAAAIARKNHDGVVDSIGDAVVVLTILAAQHRVPIESCVNVAWEQIKNRKGRMVDGVFVKDAE